MADEDYIQRVTKRPISNPSKVKTQKVYKMSSRCYTSSNRVSLVNLYDDALISIVEFFDQPDLCIFGQTCRRMRDIKRRARHLKYYFIHNAGMAWHAQRQNKLEELAIRNIKNIQLHFDSFPEYVYFGHFSTIGEPNYFNGMYTGGVISKPKYPNVRKIFVDHCNFNIDFYHFPNLEELFVVSNYKINIESLSKCTNLRKVIIYIRNQPLFIYNPYISQLPNLEVFAIHGAFQQEEYMTFSPNLKICVVYSECTNKNQGTIYIKRLREDPDLFYKKLFRQYNIIPYNITSSVHRMYYH